MRILIIDPQFENAPDIEQAVAGPDADIVVWRSLEQGFPPPEEFALCDALINCRSRNSITRETVTQMKRCRIVSQAGVGFNHIDVEACAKRGIPVCNAPDYGTAEVADHAIALSMSLLRGIVAYDSKLRAKKIGWNARALKTVRRVRGLKFGVLGLGRIGTATALRAAAFGMEIAFYDPYLAPGLERSFGYERTGSLDELMAISDVLSVHTPLTLETSGIINSKSLGHAKKGMQLVNTSRGGTMDLDAVETALRKNQLGGAALDVLPQEPLNYNHSLIRAFETSEEWLDGRLIITPHAAFYSPESIIDMRRIATENVINFLKTGRLRTCVNAELLSDFEDRKISKA